MDPHPKQPPSIEIVIEHDANRAEPLEYAEINPRTQRRLFAKHKRQMAKKRWKANQKSKLEAKPE